ncbi:alpha/beta fold hydrolase [Streptomyces zaomyceticus]|uniref:alpha/beta fold hydrolase n=1 Tax=Streptomyces zaomyceticus TaxID=68286 RepID=UPI0035DB6030
MARRLDVTGADGVRLAAWDFTPGSAPRTGPGVLLLHGLMGHAAHWAPAIDRLVAAGTRPGAEAPGIAPSGPGALGPGALDTGVPRPGPGIPGLTLPAPEAPSARRPHPRTVALDQRGHGHSEKPAAGLFTREAYVADAAAVVEQLGLGPVTLIGHSMGALTAWQLAAERPDLVHALVICDMRASALGAASQREWRDWFRRWPVPFPSLDAARRWFGEEDPWVERPNPARGAFFAEVMAEHPDGWRPVFDPEQMLTSRETWVHDAHWESLAQVRCPTLVLRGLDGELGRAEAQEMVRVLPHGVYAEIPDAGHLLHYEYPDAWREAVGPFLNGVLTS